MNLRQHQLRPPPAVHTDPQSFEILRLWAANGEQHVVIRPELCGDAGDFGYMLAELAMHAANLYSERDSIPQKQALRKLLERFRREIRDPVGNPSGSIGRKGKKAPGKKAKRSSA